MALTDAQCRAEKKGAARRKLSDGYGLQLWVQPSGRKLWQLIYQFRGKQRQLALGPYPEVSLSTARSKREAARGLLREGKDPAVKHQVTGEGEHLAGATFKEVAQEYVEKRRKENLAAVTMIKKTWLLDMAYPALGDRPIAEIRPVEILVVLRDLEERGCFESARRLRATIGAVFRYAVVTDRAEVDPTAVLRGAIAAPKVTSRAAIVDPDKFGGLLRAIYAFDGQPTTIAGLKLLALLFPRPGELRLSEWPEFDFDKCIWTIPAARTKMRREHQIYLPPQAVEILLGLQKVTGHRKYVFTGLAGSDKPISENTLNVALRRMGYGQEEMTSHGFRASASTLLNESGRWSSDAIERQLAHIEKDAVRRAYARGLFWEERVKMMIWWEKYLDALRESPRKKSVRAAA
ncbi:MAG: integrase arm-type DNA-binding domain-containing protein [Alphaproteobacteria bacterium]|nr:integrase arm-type DNA-binding domain-containing protein [Alphaproteobacteria bacterium]